MGEMVKINYHASKTAAKFHHSPAFFRGIRGPIGSGKSVACCFELFRIACGQRPDAKGVRRTRMLVVRNTMPELKSTTVKTWLDWFPEGDPKKDPTKFGIFSRQAPWTHFVRYRMPDGTLVEMEVIFLALDNEDDVKKLLSFECTAIWFNEARELLKSFVDAGSGRVGRFPSVKDGGCTRKALIADTNPPDDEHWWAKFEADPPENWAFFTQPGGLEPEAENLENHNQPENWPELSLEERREWGRGYYRDMLSGKDPEWVNVYVHNMFGTVMKGVPVYKSEWNPVIHLIKEAPKILKNALITVGIDCSGRHPAAVYLQAVGRGRYQVVRELCVMDDAGMGAEKFADYFVDDYLSHFQDSVIDEIWGDPAGNSPSQNDERTYFDILNSALKPHKLKAKAAPGLRWPDRYSAVVNMLSTLIEGRPMLEVYADCRYLVSGFYGKYMFKEMNTAGGGSRVDDRPVKNRVSNPHDALQYAASGIISRRGKIAKLQGARQVLVVSP
jgi:hypothetical protein